MNKPKCINVAMSDHDWIKFKQKLLQEKNSITKFIQNHIKNHIKEKEK